MNVSSGLVVRSFRKYITENQTPWHVKVSIAFHSSTWNLNEQNQLSLHVWFFSGVCAAFCYRPDPTSPFRVWGPYVDGSEIDFCRRSEPREVTTWMKTLLLRLIQWSLPGCCCWVSCRIGTRTAAFSRTISRSRRWCPRSLSWGT